MSEVSDIIVRWEPETSGRVTAIQIQSRIIGVTGWTEQAADAQPDAGEFRFTANAPGSDVEVQTRYRMSSGVYGEWTDNTIHTDTLTIYYADLSGVPNSLSQINAGEGGKLTGVETHATNSANPTSAFGTSTVGATQSAITANTNGLAGLQTRFADIDARAQQASTDAHQASADVLLEASRAKGAEGTLTTNLANLTQTVGTNTGAATAAINSEASVRAGSDSALGVRIDNLTTSVNGNTAGISSEAVARTNAINAVTTQLSNQYSDYTGRDANTNARINSEQTTRSNGDAALGNQLNLLTATTQPASINANSAFTIWNAGSGNVPDYWNDWSYGWNNNRVGGVNGRPYALNYQAPADRSTGVYQNVTRSFGSFVVGVTVESDNYQGAGIFFDSGRGSTAINFAAEPDSSGWTSAGDGGRYRRTFTKLYTSPIDGNISGWTLYAMANWDGFGARVAKNITFHEVWVRAATSAEIAGQRADANANTALAQISSESTVRASQTSALSSRIDSVVATAGNNSSSVTTLSQANADLYNRTNDLYNRTSARWYTQAVAGNNRAQLAIYADSNGGAGVDIVGDVAIHGNLVVDGTLGTPKVATNAITKQYFAGLGQEIVGDGNFNNYCVVYFHLDYPADIILIATGSQNYYGYVPDYQSTVYLDGQLGASSSSGAGVYVPSWALSASFSQVSPGDHVAFIPWRGGGDGIHLSAAGLTVLRAYK